MNFRVLRTTKPNLDDVQAFGKTAEKFFQKMKLCCGDSSVKKKPYLHLLREHIPDILKFWYNMFEWGYGFFHCSAGEHLNKQMKKIERYDTNQDSNRFCSTLKIIRLRQFHYSTSIFKNEESDVTCSRCKQRGHNRKNKSCPMHPDQPQLYFPDSDDDS